MKNTSHIGSGGHRPAAHEPGSSSYRAGSPALAPVGRAGTGGLCSSPARGRRGSASVRRPAHARRLVLRLQEGRLRGTQAQTALRPGQTPAALRQATAVDPGTGSLLSRECPSNCSTGSGSKPIPRCRRSRRSIAGWSRTIWMPRAAAICCARTFPVPPRPSRRPASTTCGSSTSPRALSWPCTPRRWPRICA